MILPNIPITVLLGRSLQLLRNFFNRSLPRIS
jgi:hypothetical protein